MGIKGKPQNNVAFLITALLLASACVLSACQGTSSGDADTQGGTSSSVSNSESSPSTDDADPAEPSGDATADFKAQGYLDDNGYLTVKAILDLEGTALSDVINAAGYDWNEYKWELADRDSVVVPMKGLNQEEMDASTTDKDARHFTQDDIAALAAGGKGTSIEWAISNYAKTYESLDELLESQNVEVVDQVEIEDATFGTEILAVVKNGSGENCILQVIVYPSDSHGYLGIFTPGYIERMWNGIASSIDGYSDLNDAHTVDEVWQVVAGRSVPE